MSVTGIFTNLFDFGVQTPQSKAQHFQQEFQQLGKDLEAGNLSAAQSDFTALQQLQPGSSAASSTQSSNPITQDLNQLAKDLQSGNTSAAQQDFSQLQQDLQGTTIHHHHHHHGGSDEGNTVNNLFNQLEQSLQSGNVSAAQQAYTTLQQDLTQFAQANGLTSSSSSSRVNSGSVSLIV